MITAMLDDKTFPLINLGGPNQEDLLDLPGIFTPIDYSTYQQVLQHKHILVFAERGHLIAEFIAWQLEKLSEAKVAFITASPIGDESFSIDLSTMREVSKKLPSILINPSDANPPAKIESVRNIPDSITEFNFTEVLNMLTEAQTDFLFIRHASSKDKFKIAIANLLRKFSERLDKPNMAIVNFAPCYRPFSYHDDCSKYAAYQFRLASLNRTGIVQALAQEGLTAQPSVIDRILEQTGGQPALVNAICRRLKDIVKENNQTSIANVDEAVRRMRVSPPAQCSTWTEQLKDLLKANPVLAQRFRAYVRGETLGPSYFPPPPDEIELFASGWLKINNLGRWGITSLFHEHLARKVLLVN